MWPSLHFPTLHWPQRYWAIPNNFVMYMRRQVRTRQFLEQRWLVTLINAAGTRYELGYVDIEDDIPSAISIPITVPDGTYDVEVKTWGLAWEGLVQKNTATVVVDRTSSEPITDGLPLFTNFSYDIYKEWIRLLWDGDVPLADSGLVSAGIWFTNGIPDFSTDPSVIIPLFSFQSEHVFIISEDEDFLDTTEEMHWLTNYWFQTHWIQNYWLENSAFRYAGLAAISAAGVVGAGQYIVLPDRSVAVPATVVEEG